MQLCGMQEPQKVFRCPGYQAALLNHTTYYAVIFYAWQQYEGLLVLCAFHFVYISQYLQNFNERTVSCLYK